MYNDLITSTKTKWLEGTGPHSDIVVSSRVRLARNLSGIPFPHLMNSEHDKYLYEKLEKALNSERFLEKFSPLKLISFKELNSLQKRILVEKHLISPEHAESNLGGVVFNDDQSISIMVKEEDHFRIQCILPAFQLKECLSQTDIIDDLLEETIDYAFHERYGYLTSCPTNVGTGMRASVMMHLPGLVLSKQLNNVLFTLSQVGVVVRGIYGEGTEPLSNLFQISNGTTLGMSEEEIISNLESVIKQLISQEELARKRVLEENGPQLKDRIMRTRGVLENAYLISTNEALKLLSDLKLGIDLGIITDIDPRVYNRLLIAIQPAYLLYTMGQKKAEPKLRDKMRAEIVRKTIKRYSN